MKNNRNILSLQQAELFLLIIVYINVWQQWASKG